ncbi:MAG: branched-chain amino acid ABC transporter permease [Dehalococcoidales bacterium]|nr:branched-chain amino acid ABC transporter permease [Dehalococcoidales bacterium]
MNQGFTFNSIKGSLLGKNRIAYYIGICVLLFFFILPLFNDSPYVLKMLSLTFIYIMAAMSFRVITLSGQIPLAHAGFMGVGAYCAAMLSKWLGFPFWANIFISAIVTTLLGIIIGLIFSRLRALYYAMGSLFFGIGIISIISVGGDLTGGSTGLAGIKPIFTNATQNFYLFLGITLLILIILYRFEYSRIGTKIKAVEQSYQIAASVGINERYYRVMAVGVGCFFVGIAGACYAHLNAVVVPTSFSLNTTLLLAIYTLVGGQLSFIGPILGTFVLQFVPLYFFRGFQMYSPYVSALILLLVVYLLPTGLVGIPQVIKSKFKRKSNVHAS